MRRRQTQRDWQGPVQSFSLRHELLRFFFSFVGRNLNVVLSRTMNCRLAVRDSNGSIPPKWIAVANGATVS